MASVVVALSPYESPRHDAHAIGDLWDKLGPDTATRVLSEGIEELALSVATMAAQVRLMDMADVQWQSRRLQKLALGLGLIGLANVARDLRHSHADPTAFAAVCARLKRVASTSLEGLTQDWASVR